MNNNLIDKPGIAILNGRVLVSWLMDNQLQMVTGDIQSGNVVWQPGYLFSSIITENRFGPPVGAHDIVHDGQLFYAAVVRKRNPLPGEQIEHHFLFIYTSNDGLAWTRLDSSKEVIKPQSMSIGARAQNDIIAMSSTQATALPPVAAFRFDGSSWSILDSNTILGGHPMNKGHDFTLFAKD